MSVCTFFINPWSPTDHLTPPLPYLFFASSDPLYRYRPDPYLTFTRVAGNAPSPSAHQCCSYRRRQGRNIGNDPRRNRINWGKMILFSKAIQEEQFSEIMIKLVCQVGFQLRFLVKNFLKNFKHSLIFCLCFAKSTWDFRVVGNFSLVFWLL